MKPYTATILFFALVYTAAGHSPQGVIEDRVLRDNVMTVQLHRQNWELSYPVIELNGSESLLLSFDELNENPRSYFYTFVHCDANWYPSSLSKNDYLDGFTENQITDYSLSFNTTMDYVHYRLVFPNEDVRFRISGNYVLIVYEDYDESSPVLLRRFSVYETRVNLSVRVSRPSLQEFRESGQEIDVEVNHASFPLQNPMEELYLVIRQNGRWDNAISGLTPLFFRGQTLSYDYNRENVFYGANEFRYFDIRSFRFQTEFVRNIDYKPPYYHVELLPAQSRAYRSYFYDQEFNGMFRVDVQEGREPSTDADYAYVYFTYPAPFPIENAEVHIMGDLTGWTLSNQSRMKYNNARHQYEHTLLLKQGYYNYWLVVLPGKKSVADVTVLEGSHYQTENDYLVYLYHRSTTSRYDRLIGFSMANSLSSGR